MTTETNDKPVTQTELRLAIAEFKTEIIGRMDQMEIRLIDRIHKLENKTTYQTIIIVSTILAAAHYLR